MTGETEQDSSLRALSTHFAFGQNWASYADLIDEERLAEAERGLVRLLDHVRSFTRPLSLGLLGSGCDEYVYRRA